MCSFGPQIFSPQHWATLMLLFQFLQDLWAHISPWCALSEVLIKSLHYFLSSMLLCWVRGGVQWAAFVPPTASAPSWPSAPRALCWVRALQLQAVVLVVERDHERKGLERQEGCWGAEDWHSVCLTIIFPPSSARPPSLWFQCSCPSPGPGYCAKCGERLVLQREAWHLGARSVCSPPKTLGVPGWRAHSSRAGWPAPCE